MSVGMNNGEETRKKQHARRTSATGAVCAITVAAHVASTDNRAVDVLSVVLGDVAGAATAVRDLSCRHSGRGIGFDFNSM